MLILDYDGTLAEIVDNPMQATLSVERKKILEDLNSKELITIIVNSGRPIEELLEITDHIKLDFIGNHGLFYRSKDSDKFEQIIDQKLLDQWDLLMQSMKEYIKQSILPKYNKLWLQENKHGFVLHTRLMDKGIKKPFLLEMDLLLKEKFKDVDYSTGKEIIEIKPSNLVNKGSAVEWYLNNKFNFEKDNSRIIAVGDDITDEDMFRSINKINYGVSIKILSSRTDQNLYNTAAKVIIRSVEEFYLFLAELNKIS